MAQEKHVAVGADMEENHKNNWRARAPLHEEKLRELWLIQFGEGSKGLWHTEMISIAQKFLMCKLLEDGKVSKDLHFFCTNLF